MPLVVGISFKKVGKVYYFDPAGIDLHEGDFVIAETARGIEFGEVMLDPKDVTDAEIVSPLKKIVRRASDDDVHREEHNRARERDAFCICQDKIHAHNLPMKLIDAEYCFDGSQVTFYFSADARVDFRELVKDLAGALRSKVQLHQVGVRDEAKLLGGLGPCGRVLCCASFLNGFEPVSMKMAKEQSLFLNPLKFSGICGKLMCCLKYEYQTYRDAKSRLPNLGALVETPKGPGKICEVDIIKEYFNVVFEDGTTEHYSRDELTWQSTAGCPGHSACVECPGNEYIEEIEDEGIEDEDIVDRTVISSDEIDFADDTVTTDNSVEQIVTSTFRSVDRSETSVSSGESVSGIQQPQEPRSRRWLGKNFRPKNTCSTEPQSGGPDKPAADSKPQSEHSTEGGQRTGRSRNRRRHRKPNTGNNP